MHGDGLGTGLVLNGVLEAQDSNLAQLLAYFAKFIFFVIPQTAFAFGQDFFSASPGGSDEEDSVEALFVSAVSGFQAFEGIAFQLEAGLLATGEVRLPARSRGPFSDPRMMGQCRGNFTGAEGRNMLERE